VRLHRISIIVDQALNVEGLTVTTDYDTRAARHRPIDVSPFASPREALGAALGTLDVQLTLWDAPV
jgi:hypothetical protein